MQKYQDVIIAAGLPVSGASVLVRPTGVTTSTSVIYSDSGTTTKTNPTTTDGNGRFTFYGANGRYDLVYSGGTPTITPGTMSDVMLEDVPLSNLSELSTASAARDNIGLGSAAVVSTSTLLQKINDLSDLGTASNARANLGLGSAAVVSTAAFLQAVNNLSELSTSTLPGIARANLGLGSAAVVSTSTFFQRNNNLSDVTSTASAQANLGLVIGTNVQAFSTGIVTSTGTNTFSAAQRGAVVALASTGQIAPNLGAANNFSLAMTVNTTLATPTNIVAGQSGRIAITQNSTAMTLAYDSAFWKFAAGATATLSTATAVGTVDVLRYYTITSTSAECEMRNGVA